MSYVLAMLKLAAMFAVLCVSTTAYAEEWTTGDTIAQVAVTASLTMDWYQTERIIRAPIDPNRRESNPIMGRTGNRVPPEAYFPIVIGAQLVVARVLPQPWRGISQGLVLVFQADSIRTNWQAGYTFSF